VAVFDFASAVELDAEGIRRVCLLRRQLLPWGEITGIVQPRKRGLVVITDDRKRHILIDRMIGEDELDLFRTQARLRDVHIEF
jgi:hypothetical protein